MSYSCSFDVQLYAPKTGLYCVSLLNNSTLWGDLSYYIRGHARPQQMINIDKPGFMYYLNLQAWDFVEFSGILDGVQKETKLEVKQNQNSITYNLYDFVKDKSGEITKRTGVIIDAHSLYPLNAVCSHEWKHYQGLLDTYNYCVKCDVKDKQ